MAIHFEKFSGGPFQRSVNSLRVSIDRNLIIRMNRYTAKALGHPEAVTLYFDRQHSIIGIRPARSLDPEAFPLLVRDGYRFSINAASFCRHFRISVVRTERFDNPELDDEGYLRLDLRRTHDVSNNRKRSDARQPTA